MSDIKTSLQNLSVSVGNLEAALDLIEDSMAKSGSGNAQRDMFSNGKGEAIAKKLDKAIAHVEQMLGDAR